jgi:hypothetical protein
MNFKAFLTLVEGGFINDDKAEEGKSRPKKPFWRSPSSVTTSGIAGGPGGYKGSAGAGPPMPMPQK